MKYDAIRGYMGYTTDLDKDRNPVYRDVIEGYIIRQDEIRLTQHAVVDLLNEYDALKEALRPIFGVLQDDFRMEAINDGDDE